MKKLFNIRPFFLLAFVFGAAVINVSCESDELEDHSFDVDDELNLTLSDSILTLEESFINNELVFNWSTGTNKGTNAAIRYNLEIDLATEDFSDPLLSPMKAEKARYVYSIDHGTLNNILLENGLEAGETYELQAQIIADVADENVEAQKAQTNFTVKTFKPVSSQLFILGDATPNGWDIGNAIELTASTAQRGVFIYEGPLTAGNFKFTVSRDDCFCQDFYTKDSNDDSMIVYNEGGGGEDLQWTIEKGGNYEVRVDLLNKTISINPVAGAPFSDLWIVGDATESGWNIESPVAFEQNEEDPFIFEYEGNLSPGEMKIFAGPLGDWCGEWYRPIEAGQPITNNAVEQNSGCDVDNTWKITEETVGRYKISVNTRDASVSFEPVNLYIVGDGGPSGWDIASPQALTYDNGDFVFNGELGTINPTGEFKFSNQQGDWCGGEWINSANASQSISNTNFIITQGCEGPDNKWKLKEGEAGTYKIRINLDTETMTITRL